MTSGHRYSAPFYVAGSVAIGLGMGMPGPTISLLKRQVGVGTGAIGVVFTAQGLGYLVASQVIARGYDRGWGHRLQSTAMVTAAASLALVPSAHSVVQLVAVFVLMGLATGTVDVGSNTQMVWGKGTGAGGWLAALHLGFGVGALSSPLVARWSETSAGTTSIAFRTPAVLLAIVAVGIAVTHGPHPPHLLDITPGEPVTPSSARGIGWFVGFILLYVGGEVGFTAWLNTFARGIGESPGSAAALNSVFWAAFTAGRFANLSIARRATSFRPLLVLAFAAAATTSLQLSLSTALVWISVAGFGLVVGPQFPLTIALVGRRVPLSGTRMGWFMGAAGVGSLTWPWLIGELIDRHGPRALPTMILGLFGGATLLGSFGSGRVGGGTSGAERRVHHRGGVGFVADEAHP